MVPGPMPSIRDELAAPAHHLDQDNVDQDDHRDDAELPAVTPQAPIDVRLLDAIGAILESRPRWSKRAPSTAEAWEYSTTGDWSTQENSIRRGFHSLTVLIAFVVTYPLLWALDLARQKPSAFWLGVALLIVLSKVL